MTDRELLEAIYGDTQELKARVTSVENRLDSVENKLDKVEDAVTGVKLHLENATDKNILTVAEGHLDLSRKLDDALKIENEKEILKIRLNYLSDEMEQIKNRLTKLEQTA